jgi:hypothetical protein
MEADDTKQPDRNSIEITVSLWTALYMLAVVAVVLL